MGKQNLRDTCPKGKLEFKFFFEPCIGRNFSRVEPLNTGLPNVCRLRVCAVGEFPLIHVYFNPASGFKQLLDELDQQKNCPTVSFQKMK